MRVAFVVLPVALLTLACGAQADQDFKTKCDHEGGTYTLYDDGTARCEYPNNQEQP